MLQRYLRQPDRVLDRIRFVCQGARYYGRGVMVWHPDEGFLIEAPVERVGPVPRSVALGRGGIIRSEDLRSIRMRELNSPGWILAPEVIMRDRLDVIIQQRLSVHVARIIVSKPQSTPGSNINRLTENSIFQKPASIKSST